MRGAVSRSGETNGILLSLGWAEGRMSLSCSRPALEFKLGRFAHFDGSCRAR